jgi:hypothetical protein
VIKLHIRICVEVIGDKKTRNEMYSKIKDNGMVGLILKTIENWWKFKYK